MARNMNGMAIYIPNGRDTPDEPRRSPISSFGADMDTGRVTRYNADGTQENFYNNPAQQMFTQMGQLVEQGKAARKQKRSMDDAALASALIYSKQNGGFMPREMVNAVSQQLGQQIVKDPTKVPDELFEGLRKFYTDEQIIIIVGFGAQMQATNNFNSVLGVDVDKRLLPLKELFKPATWRENIK